MIILHTMKTNVINVKHERESQFCKFLVAEWFQLSPGSICINKLHLQHPRNLQPISKLVIAWKFRTQISKCLKGSWEVGGFPFCSLLFIILDI